MSLGQRGLYEITPILAIIFDCVVAYKTITILYYKSLD